LDHARRRTIGDEDHPVRAIWELVGRLDLSAFASTIGSLEGGAGRPADDPQLLVSLWIYAYSRGIGSAREVERRCEHDPGFRWLTGLLIINHHTGVVTLTDGGCTEANSVT
jgi:transposase